MKPVNAWAVVSGKRLTSYGNGAQWQFPVFLSRNEARHWIKEEAWCRSGPIVRVEIRELPKKARKP